MRKIILAGCSILLLIFCACSQTNLSSIPRGCISCDEHLDKNGFQDYVDYCKYNYSSADAVVKRRDYNRVSESDVEIIKAFLTISNR